MILDKPIRSLFIMPRDSKSWAGSEALWITAAGFASAAEHIFGNSVVSTRDLIAKPEEVRNFPLNKPQNFKSPTKSKYPFIPLVLKTLLKDVLLYKSNPKIWPFENKLSDELKFVWEQHDMFSGIGYLVAKKYKVPYMVYVHGPAVWEAKKWGVKRPVWGTYLEKRESDNLKKADIVGCVSEEVANQLQKMGVKKSKIKVIPMLVDTTLFTPKSKNANIINQYNLKNKFVIGWTGSFRSFHGLDKVIKAFKSISNEKEDAVLMLVGDGQLKASIQNLVEELNLEKKVIFTGNQKFTDIPDFLSVFDIALVSANSSKGFHYSPLKLREYLACQKATIVPKAGDLLQQFDDEKEVLFYDVEAEDGLVKSMKKLIEDNALGNKLENNGYQKVIKSGTWYSELLNVIQELNCTPQN
jgi:glycosyltransferase involved in cell wall biosynthesis